MDERPDERIDEGTELASSAGDSPPLREDADPPPKGIPPVAEALGYIGGALALSAVVALLSTFWPQLGLAGHVAISLTLAVAGLAGGFAFARNETPAAQRLSQFLLLAGVVGVGATAGFAVRDALYYFNGFGAADAAQWGWFAGAAGVALAGGLVWSRTMSLLHHVLFAAGVAGTVLLSLPLLPFDGPAWAAGAVLVVVALIWGSLSLAHLLPPNQAGVVLGALGVFAGVEMMVIAGSGTLLWALWLGAAACTALVVLGSVIQQYGVLGIGAVGLTAFCAQLVGEYLGFGAGTGIAMVVVGFVVLGIAIRLILRLADDASANRRVASEVAGYLGIALAMAGAGLLVAETWDALGVFGRIAVPLVGAAVAYVAAFALDHRDSSIARRLEQLLLAIGVLATAITAAMIARPITEQLVGITGKEGDAAVNWTTLAASVSATIAGGVVWWLRKGALTQIVFLTGILMNVIVAINFVGPDTTVPLWVFGAVAAAIGIAWVALGAAERIIPVRTALGERLRGYAVRSADDVQDRRRLPAVGRAPCDRRGHRGNRRKHLPQASHPSGFRRCDDHRVLSDDSPAGVRR